jgi:prephenate dehydrogenase
VGEARRANVVGLGLIGGSIGRALRARGWWVEGTDVDAARVAEAVRQEVIDEAGLDRAAELTFVAVPALATPDAVKHVLETTSGLVTDTAGVKASVVGSTTDPRFLGGHPMAGSEQDGLEGADGELFEGAVWVLTPTAETTDEVFATVASTVSSLGAEVVALTPERHDSLVAVVSHVPHLAAATLMTLADDRAEEHAALLRLAAGGFRDMTRIAAGHPAIWPDICEENRAAIVEGLDGLIAGLRSVRDVVDRTDRDALLALLTRARAARTNLPTRVARPADLAEVRIPIPDRPGAAAEVFTLASELGVNVADFEVYHSAEGAKGIMILLIEATATDLFRGGLIARGFRPGVRRLE